MLEKINGSTINGQQFKQLLLRDHQSSCLGINDEDIDDIFRNSPEMTPEATLHSLAAVIAKKNEKHYDAVIFKCGSAGLWWPALRSTYPNASFIHIYRDVRAVVNSALHTQRPYHPGQKMGRGDPWFRAKGWNRYVTHMHRLSISGEPIAQVSYESFCHEPQLVLERLMNDFCLCEVSKADLGSLAVSSQELSIHQNVNKPPLKERLNAWETELKPWQVVVCESLAAEGMGELGYKKQTRLRRHSMYLCYGYFYHVYATLKFKLGRAKKWIFSPHKVLLKLQNRHRTRSLRSWW
jgi:hypothetical protein